MGKGMTKSEIIGHMAEKSGLTRKQVGEFFDHLAQLAYTEAPNGFVVPGLGKLVLAERAARMGRNPKTGEPIHIPAKKSLKFRFAKEAKDAIAPKASSVPAVAEPAPSVPAVVEPAPSAPAEPETATN